MLINQSRERAAALLLSLGMLAVLGVLGITFTRMTSLERNAARNHYHQTNARFLALAGVERAMGELQTLALNGSLDSLPPRNWLYVPNRAVASLVDTLSPSLWFDTNGDGILDNGIDGAKSDDLIYGRMVSGVIESSLIVAGDNYNDSYDKWGKTYKLRIIDNSGLIQINSPQPNLARLLESLGKALSMTHLINPVPAGKGAKIVAERIRVGGRFTRKKQLLEVLTPDEFELLQYYICLDGWTDPDTVKPVALGARYKPLVLGDTVHAMDELNPIKIEAEPRAPININSAPKPILAALLMGVKGFYLDEKVSPSSLSNEALFDARRKSKISYTSGKGLGTLTESKALTLVTALKLADAILAFRKKTRFSYWAQFNAFLQFQVTAKIIDKYQSAALSANCNPNTNLNETNPSALIWKPIDKTDLTAYTTELGFISTGFFTIESLGRVTLNRGITASLHTIRTDISIFELQRETTQKQFMAGYLKGGELDGKTSTGRSLQSYPEPLSTDSVKMATYDGHLTLATVRRGILPGNMFYASLYGTLSGILAGGGILTHSADAEGPFERAFLTGDRTVHPGDLRPDGVYVERGSSLAYLASKTWSQRRGGLSFWFKPNWDPAQTPRPHNMLSLTRKTKLATSGTVQADHFGVWYFPPEIAPKKDYGPYPWFPAFPSARALTFGNWIDLSEKVATLYKPGYLKTGIASHTLNHDGHADTGKNALAGRKWIHVAIGWDWDAPLATERVMLFINGERVSASNAFHSGAIEPTAHKEHLDANDLTAHSDGAPNLLRMGELASFMSFNHAADATFGELRSYASNAGDLTSDYRAGRYNPYDGTFFSLPRHYTSKRTISHVSWTAYHPNARSKATIKIYDTLGTKDFSDDKLVAQGDTLHSRLEVGKTVDGSRYELILSPKAKKKGPCWTTVRLKIIYPASSTGTLKKITIEVPGEAAPGALETETNSEGWTATGIPVDSATGMGGWIYTPPASSGPPPDEPKGNNGLGNGVDPPPNDKSTNYNDTPEKVEEKGKTGSGSDPGSGGTPDTTVPTPKFVIVTFKVPCDLVNRLNITTTVETPGTEPTPAKGNNGLGNGVDPPPNDKNTNYNDTPEKVEEKGKSTDPDPGTGGSSGTPGTTSEHGVTHDISSRDGKPDGNGYTSNIVDVVESHDTTSTTKAPDPVNESPVFDDITVTSFTGITILRWIES